MAAAATSRVVAAVFKGAAEVEVALVAAAVKADSKVVAAAAAALAAAAVVGVEVGVAVGVGDKVPGPKVSVSNIACRLSPASTIRSSTRGSRNGGANSRANLSSAAGLFQRCSLV